ncbi:hypothetical protein AB1Y20_023455 [Prymnesium parvum]|uniref:Uncharacterized protein n=1 Tax=Prymnesium parvum TaxID=97485 RepID=A0AB34JGF6_PRYPA
MPLSFEVLERIRFEHLADDLEVEARMLAWTYEQADAYFESGGMHEPRPPSRPPEPSEPEPDATGSATAADRPPPVGRKAGPSRPAAAGGEREGDAAQTATGRTTRREEECTNEGAAESITTAQSACELSGPEAMASRDRRRRVAAAGEGTGVAALEERGVDVDELSVLAADHPAVVADRLKQLGYDTLGSRVQIVVQLKDRYRAAQVLSCFCVFTRAYSLGERVFVGSTSGYEGEG